jgi:ABC-type Fe3+-citrate transport system substrate-binding protein
MMLASLTIFLLLSINTINCIASQNNSRSKTTEDVGGSTTSNGNEGRIIILILFNR